MAKSGPRCIFDLAGWPREAVPQDADQGELRVHLRLVRLPVQSATMSIPALIQGTLSRKTLNLDIFLRYS